MGEVQGNLIRRVTNPSPAVSNGCNVTRWSGEAEQGEEPMDKDFFVQELEAHSSMLYRVAYTILRDDVLPGSIPGEAPVVLIAR